MNRPNKKDFATYGEYDVAMNKYCDELEEKLASYIDAESGFSQRIEELEKQILIRDEKIIQKNEEIMKLNKALDRLIDYTMSLECVSKSPCVLCKFEYICSHQIDLKKYLLKEVQDE